MELHFNAAGRNWDAHVGRTIPAAALAVCITSILRQPVKLISEDQPHGERQIHFSYRAGVDGNGRLTALEADVFMNGGAYAPFADEMTARLAIAAAGMYLCRHTDIRVKTYKSNSTPWMPFSSWGMAQGSFAIEMLANHIALEIGQDPAQWRIHNLSAKGNLNTTTGKIKQTPPLAQMIEKISKDSDYTRKHAASRQIRTSRVALAIPPSSYAGIGLAVTRQGYDFLTRDRQYTAASVSMTLTKAGELEVLMGTVPASPGILAIWKKSIASDLGIDEEQIKLVQDWPDEHSFSGPSCLSRNVMVYTRLIEQCCGIIQKKRFRETLPITETRSFRRRTSAEWDEEEMKGIPFSQTSWGAAVVEVAVNTGTKEISIPDIWLSISCGAILDPSAARSYLEAEVRLALAQCIDKQAINPTLFPRLHINFETESRKSTPPGGLEGLALGTIPAAFIQAVSQAAGRTVRELPLNSSHLMEGAL